MGDKIDISNGKLEKYGITRKSIYSISSVLMCIILVVVLTLTQAGFDAQKLKTIAFWIEFVIMAGFSIFGMLSGQRTSDDVARNKPNGAFRVLLKKFFTALNMVNDGIYFAFFGDWIENYRERKRKLKIERFLKDCGIKQLEVLDLDYKELQMLKQPFKKDWSNTIHKGKYKNDTTYFLSCSDEQINAVKFVFNGGVKVSELNTDFFTTVTNLTEKDMWESAATQEKKKALFLAVNYSYRLVLLLAICLVTTALTAGQFEETAAQTVLTLIKRIFVIVSSYIWGVYIGSQMVKIDMEYIEFKVNILKLYYTECQTGIYKHEDIEEIAKKDYETQEIENIIESEETKEDGI